MLDKLQLCQRALGPNYAGDEILRMTVLRACKGVPEFEHALPCICLRPRVRSSSRTSVRHSNSPSNEATVAPGADPYAAYGGYAAYVQYYQQYYAAAQAAQQQQGPGAPGAGVQYRILPDQNCWSSAAQAVKLLVVDKLA